jgi:hypothetical protein
MPSVRHCATRRPRLAPNRRFAPAGGRAGEQQVRDVGASNQEHESDGTSQCHQRWLRVSHDRFVGAHQPHSPSFVRLRIRRFELCGGGVQFSLGRLERHARLQSADNIHEPAVAGHAGHVVLDRRPQFHLLGRKAESRRHHTDHDVRTAFHHHRATDDATVAGEQALPHGVAEHDDFVTTRPIVTRFDAASEQGRRAERWKQRSGDAGTEHAFRQLETGDVERPPREQSHRFERRELAFPVLVVGKGTAWLRG